MTESPESNPTPGWPNRPDPFGRNIPPNERVIREWQPEFTPLGQTPGETPAAPPAQEAAPGPAPAAPFSPPLERQWMQPASPPRRHRRRYQRSHPQGWGIPWFFVIIAMVAFGVIGHMWWIIFLIGPLGWMFRRLANRNPSLLGLLLIGGGTLALMSVMGLTAALALPVVLIGAGLVILLRTLRAPSRI